MKIITDATLAEDRLIWAKHLEKERDEARARVSELEGEAESIDVADRNARRLEDKCDEMTRTIRGLNARVAEPAGIYDVGALEGDRNALRDRVADLEGALKTALDEGQGCRQNLRDRNARVEALVQLLAQRGDGGSSVS